MAASGAVGEYRSQLRRMLRVLMAAERMSQEDLGTAIGKSQQYISRRLRGETPFDEDDLEAIAAVFRRTPRDLYPDGENPPIIYPPSLLLPNGEPAFDFGKNAVGMRPVSKSA